MKVPSRLFNLCVKALTQSMDIRVMTGLVRSFIPHYNLHERTGIPDSMSVPNQEAGNQIMKDMVKNETFLDFVLLLVKVGDQGYKGRYFKIPYLWAIINEVIALGYQYDSENDIFIENSSERRTRNWGALRQGEEYTITFLRIDIVGNSELVRRYSQKKIAHAYGSLREVVEAAIRRRDGRLWSWDGDGGLAAFFRGKKHQDAVLAGMEILHELFLFDHTTNPLDESLKVRIAAHGGPFVYSADEEALQNSETVERTMYIEQQLCKPSMLVVSEVVKMMLDSLALGRLKEFRDDSSNRFYSYALKLERQ